MTAGLSDVPGLLIASNPESPIVFLKLEKSTGSMKNDLSLLENITDRVSKIALSIFYSYLLQFLFPNCCMIAGVEGRLCICGGFQKINT